MRRSSLRVLHGLLALSLAASSANAADPAAPAKLRMFRIEKQTPYEISPDQLRYLGLFPTPVVVDGEINVAGRLGASIDARLQRVEQTLDQLESRIESLQRAIQNQGLLGASDRRGEPGFRGLYMMNRDGTGIEYLVAAPGMIATSDAAWSNDGNQLAMNGLPQVDAFNKSKIYIYTLTGRNAGTMRDLGYGNTPAWSPDDRQIAYMVNGGNPGGAAAGLWVMNADGSERRRIGQAWWPRWSPDGSVLCCHGWRSNGEPTLVLFDPKTGDSRKLLENSGWTLVEYAGSWSPDGQRIAFVGEHQGKRHLATISADGSNDSIRILYTNEDRKLAMFGPPSWARDARQILFSMEDAGRGERRWWKSNLYSMAPDIPCAPVLLEGRRIGNINRMATFSPDSSKIIFSSER